MSHLENSNADSAQSKEVWNEHLEFLRSSADCLFSADWNENLEFLMSSAVCLLSADCLLGQILFIAAGHL